LFETAQGRGRGVMACPVSGVRGEYRGSGIQFTRLRTRASKWKESADYFAAAGRFLGPQRYESRPMEKLTEYKSSPRSPRTLLSDERTPARSGMSVSCEYVAPSRCPIAARDSEIFNHGVGTRKTGVLSALQSRPRKA